MHQTVRIYIQPPPVTTRVTSARRIRAYTSVRPQANSIADWLLVEWAVTLAAMKTRFKIVAVGCEEGAMVVHFA